MNFLYFLSILGRLSYKKSEGILKITEYFWNVSFFPEVELKCSLYRHWKHSFHFCGSQGYNSEKNYGGI